MHDHTHSCDCHPEHHDPDHHHHDPEMNEYIPPLYLLAGTLLPPVESDPATLIQNIASIIDHTLLKPDATSDHIRQLCEEAVTHGFYSVCVNSGFVPLASQLLEESDVKVCTVVGFPLGANLPEIKVMEAEIALLAGADEIDMVLPIGALKAGNYEWVMADIQGVVETCYGYNALCKVIIETALLTDDEKVVACQLAKAAGADFVKTSTGFASGGATVADVQLMRQTVGNTLGVKASGGIRTRQDAISLIEAGANRLGASASIRIING